MKCPYCNSDKSEVVDKRNRKDFIWRRRYCLNCGKRFTTKECVFIYGDRNDSRYGE